MWVTLGLLLGLIPFAAPLYAALTENAPQLTMYTAVAFEDVAEDGDLLVIWRYTMATETWEVHTVTGAIVSLTQGATIHQDRVPTLLGENMSAFYLAAGHAFTFDATATVDIQSNPALFINNTSSSATIQFVATSALIAASTEDQTVLCAATLGMLAAVESQDASDTITAGTYVTAAIGTTAGTNIALTAFGLFANVLPECFQAGVTSGDGFDPNPDLLKTGRVAAVEATEAWVRFDALAADFGFDSAPVAAALLGISVAGSVVVLSMLLLGSAMYGATLGSLVLLAAAMNAPHFMLQGVFVLAIFSVLGASAFWFRSMPR